MRSFENDHGTSRWSCGSCELFGRRWIRTYLSRSAKNCLTHRGDVRLIEHRTAVVASSVRPADGAPGHWAPFAHPPTKPSHALAKCWVPSVWVHLSSTTWPGAPVEWEWHAVIPCRHVGSCTVPFRLYAGLETFTYAKPGDRETWAFSSALARTCFVSSNEAHHQIRRFFGFVSDG